MLPVKIRWLALLQWIMYGMTMVYPSSTWLTAAMVIAAVFNYLVFFGRDICARHEARPSADAVPVAEHQGHAERAADQARVPRLRTHERRLAARRRFATARSAAATIATARSICANHEHVTRRE